MKIKQNKYECLIYLRTLQTTIEKTILFPFVGQKII